jgi:hypothetical protein
VKFGRSHSLGLALAATIGLSAWTLLTPEGEPEIVFASPRSAPRGDGAAEPRSARSSRDAGRAGREVEGPGLAVRPGPPERIANIFSTYSFQPTPPPPRPSTAAQAVLAAAPPNYTYIGRIIEADRTTYLFLSGVAPVRLAPGDRDGSYELVDGGNGEVVFRHIPSGQQVSIPAPSLK